LDDLIRSARLRDELGDTLALSYVSRWLPRGGDLRSAFELPREEQLRVLDSTAQELIASGAAKPFAEAWIGFQAARLANGSLDYLGLLDRYRDTLPAALLWFVFFSIWRPGYDGLVNGQCLGRRLAKELVVIDDVFGQPTADINLEELEVLAGGKAQSTFRTKLASIVEVELLPCVTAKFRQSRQKEEVRSDRMPEIDVVAARRALEEAVRALGGGIDISRLSPRGADLFEKVPREGKRPRQPKKK
jgi:hypothetical protein